MPMTTVQKMMGAISILMSLMKASATGLRSAPTPGHSHPSRMPATMAITSWVNSDVYHRFLGGASSPAVGSSVTSVIDNVYRGHVSPPCGTRNHGATESVVDPAQ